MARRPNPGTDGERTLAIGVEFVDDGLKTVGLDAVNKALRKGLRVVRIEEAPPSVAEVEDSEGGVDYALAGVGFTVVLAPAEAVDTP
ncbi:MAG: hypothetical protein ACKO5K_07225 [Armatimonadota bacterium]